MKTVRPSAAVADFERRIREAGEPAARLDLLADVAISLLEARRDYRLGKRTGAGEG